jgi:hypothetical protein
MPSNHEVLSSNPNTARERKREREMKGTDRQRETKKERETIPRLTVTSTVSW